MKQREITYEAMYLMCQAGPNQVLWFAALIVTAAAYEFPKPCRSRQNAVEETVRSSGNRTCMINFLKDSCNQSPFSRSRLNA